MIVAEPAATAVTVPSTTVATLSALDDQVTSLFVAVSGSTVAVSVLLSPTVMVRLVSLNDKLSTG